MKCWETPRRRWEGSCLISYHSWGRRVRIGENEDEPVQVAVFMQGGMGERGKQKICGLNSFCGTEILPRRDREEKVWDTDLRGMEGREKESKGGG